MGGEAQKPGVSLEKVKAVRDLIEGWEASGDLALQRQAKTAREQLGCDYDGPVVTNEMSEEQALEGARRQGR